MRAIEAALGLFTGFLWYGFSISTTIIFTSDTYPSSEMLFRSHLTHLSEVLKELRDDIGVYSIIGQSG